MVATELLLRVAALRDARQAWAAADSTLLAKREAFEAEYAPLIATTKAARDAVTAAETALRAVAEQQYATTKEPNLCPGITIKMFDVMKYKPEDALAWARDTKLALLPESLDKKAFEKIAKATRLPFVDHYQEPRVNISADLDAALSTVESPVGVE